MKWNRRFRGLTMFAFNFGVGSLEQSVKLSRLVILDFSIMHRAMIEKRSWQKKYRMSIEINQRTINLHRY